MIIKIYAVRDLKGALYVRPFFGITEADATRQFTSAIRDKQTMLGQYPDDYELFELATFNDNEGLISGYDKPKFIVSGSTVVHLDLIRQAQHDAMIQASTQKAKE